MAKWRFFSRTNSISKESDASLKIADCFNSFFFLFSYGRITKNLKILLSSRKRRENAIIRRFVIL